MHPWNQGVIVPHFWNLLHQCNRKKKEKNPHVDIFDDDVFEAME
jgi:hypothetical protein